MVHDSPSFLRRLKQRTRDLRRDVFALYLAVRHPSTPWYAKVLATAIVIYAASPFDLIPDPVPVLGYLDDIVIIPLGVLAVRWMIPAATLAECREQAAGEVRISPVWKWAGGTTIALLWFLCIAWMGLSLWRWSRSGANAETYSDVTQA